MGDQRIQSKKIYEEVSESIINQLKAGELKPGDKLDSVEQLARNFNVSRSAVREALSGLRAIDVIEIRQGEGTYITHFDAKKFSLPASAALLVQKGDMQNVTQVREILEVGAAGLAAQYHKKEDLEKMENALQAMKNARNEEELGEQADLDFHLAVMKGTQNEMLVNLLQSVSDITMNLMRETRRLVLYNQKGSIRLFNEHKLIYEAIKQGDVERAKKNMVTHLQGVSEVISKYIHS